MPELNTTRASLEPEPLIGEAVADSPGAALSRAAFLAILDGHTPLLTDLVEATASAAEVGGLIGRGLMLDETGHVVAAHGLSLVPARQHRLTIGRRCGSRPVVNVHDCPGEPLGRAVPYGGVRPDPQSRSDLLAPPATPPRSPPTPSPPGGKPKGELPGRTATISCCWPMQVAATAAVRGHGRNACRCRSAIASA
jgi:hypothetical protein